MISHLDHLVLTTADEAACTDFYTRVMGMSLESFGPGGARKAFRFGTQKINLHVKGAEFEPKAHRPSPGALDLCFIAQGPLDGVIAHLRRAGCALEEGPVVRTGATGPIRSVYLRDPDLNLIEISEPISKETPMNPFSRRRFVAAASLGAATFALPAGAQTAGKPVTLVVPTAAGGTTDIAARMLAEPLGKLLGTSAVVDNRGGGNGNIGGQIVARAPADGTTLLVQYSGYQSITPLIQPVAGFDPGKDLRPLGHLIDAPQVLVVRADFPANTFQEFLRYVKAHPGKVNYASSGNGSLQHVTTELLKDLTKTFMTHIPYRGTGPAMTDLLAGTVDLTITTPPPLLPHIRAGKLKALMVTGRTRLAALPQVPTATEAGVPLVASSWFAVYGPAGLPVDVQGRLSAAIRQVVDSEAFRKRAEEQGAKAVFLGAAELDKLATDERAMWGRIVKVANIRAD